MTWLFEEQLTFGSPTSRIGLVTLWTSQKHYADLDRALFRVMGNLYAEDGVNYIARNILAHPQEVQSLIICGSDGILQETNVRQALLNWQVTDPMIPSEEVAWLRENITLIQCEREELVGCLMAENARLASLPVPDREPATYPFPQETAVTFPSELSGMRVLWSSIYDAWIDALRHVLRFGVMEGRRKFLLNLVSVVDGDDDRLPAFLTPERAQAYAESFLSPEKDEAVTYTYGNRLLAWGSEHADEPNPRKPSHPPRHREDFRPPLNLLEIAIEKLQRDPLSSRCMLDLWDNREDLWSEEPPCLTHIILNHVQGALYLTGFYRSHDLYRAYFLHLYALRRMQHLVAERLGWSVGKLTTISTHAHIYEWDLEAAQAAVEQAGRPKCVFDPRGNIAITRRDGKPLLILYSPDGRRLAEYHGSPRRVLRLLLDDHALSQPSHWTYVTRELFYGTE